MKRAFRAALLIPVLLFAASPATCYFGVQHEIAKLPADPGRNDTAWIGMEWVERGIIVQAIAFTFAAATGVAWL
jgi:hypothetical protein